MVWPEGRGRVWYTVKKGGYLEESVKKHVCIQEQIPHILYQEVPPPTFPPTVHSRKIYGPFPQFLIFFTIFGKFLEVYGVVQFSPLSITITDGKPDFSSAMALSLFNKIKKVLTTKTRVQKKTFECILPSDV